MDKESDFLDKLYSEKFDKFEDQAFDNDWIKLSSKLGKSNFLKFSFVTFNVFYLAVILTFAATSTYMSVSNIIKTKKIQNLEKKIEELQQKQDTTEAFALTNDSIIIENTGQEAEVKNEINLLKNENKKELKQNRDEEKADKSIAKSQIGTAKDSVFIKPDSSSVNRIVPVKINKVKKTIFIKQNKVLVKDTVVIKKKERK